MYFYQISNLSDEPFTLPFHDDGLPLQHSYELTPEQWRERYKLMREEYNKFLWFYSPICARITKMRRLLRHLCKVCLEAEKNPQFTEPFLHVRDMDLALGFITPKEYEIEETSEHSKQLESAFRDSHTNRTLEEICKKITEEAEKFQPEEDSMKSEKMLGKH